MKRIIKLTENDLCKIVNESIYQLINEGIEYTVVGDKINAHINSNQEDSSNDTADTRVFGTKHDIINGDGTGKKKTLKKEYSDKDARIKAYEAVIDYIKNGRTGVLKLPENISKKTATTIAQKLNDASYDDETLLKWAKKLLLLVHFEGDENIIKYNQVSSDKTGKLIPRYTIGRIPRTDFKYISLFNITDFNFTDVLKNGYLRQNQNTDKLLGITKDERETDVYGNKVNLELTYDGKELPKTVDGKPDISDNFSLSGVNPYHFKQSSKLNGETYNSINKFLDKSIVYASYALKKENFIPDLIVSVPSSSSFNKFYCKNLSNKLGIPYIEDFFKRDAINVHLEDGRSVEELINDGVHPTQIEKFKSSVSNIALKEISYFISLPLRNFIEKHKKEFIGIAKSKYSREQYSLDDFTKHMIPILYNMSQTNDYLSDYLMKFDAGNYRNLYTLEENEKIPYYAEAAKKNGIRWSNTWVNDDGGINIKKMVNKIGRDNASAIINMGKEFCRLENKKRKQKIEEFINKFINRNFNEVKEVLSEVKKIADKYSKVLKENGYKPNFFLKRFKITELPKETRNYLHGLYVVADKNFKENTNFYKRFVNSKVLLFDEDINSGASLRLAAEALVNKLPKTWNHKNLIALVNASAKTGF